MAYLSIFLTLNLRLIIIKARRFATTFRDGVSKGENRDSPLWLLVRIHFAPTLKFLKFKYSYLIKLMIKGKTMGKLLINNREIIPAQIIHCVTQTYPERPTDSLRNMNTAINRLLNFDELPKPEFQGVMYIGDITEKERANIALLENQGITVLRLKNERSIVLCLENESVLFQHNARTTIEYIGTVELCDCIALYFYGENMSFLMHISPTILSYKHLVLDYMKQQLQGMGRRLNVMIIGGDPNPHHSICGLLLNTLAHLARDTNLELNITYQAVS